MSVEITDHMAEVLRQQLAFIATTSPDGVPNVGPKGSIGVYDHKALVFDETTGGTTLSNIQEGSPVMIAVVDRAWKNGYRFTGRTEILDAGDIFTDRVQARADHGKAAQICSVLVHVDEVSTFRPA